MRIVHAVRSDAFAGVERYIASVVAALHARGHDVSVVGGDTPALRRLAGPSVVVAGAASTREVARQLGRLDHVDVVHVHMTAAEAAGAFTKRSHRAPLVSTRHFLGRRGKSAIGRVGAPVIRRALDGQLSVSRAVADSIGEPSVVLSPGVARTTAHQGPRAKTVLVLQRLEKEKRTDVALRAWAKTRARHASWTLEIAGDGALRPSLEALSGELGISDSVRFLGYISDTAERLGAASILLASADAEPFGLSVVEAMAAATPVVAASGGGHNETVGLHPGARLFGSGDTAAAAAEIDALVEDDATRLGYGAELRDLQRAHFDLDDHVDRLVEFYAQFV